MFELIASDNVLPDQIATVIADLCPGLTIALLDSDTENADVYFSLTKTDDVDWPVLIYISTLHPPLSFDTGAVTFAEALHEKLKLDCITDTCGLVFGLDPHDPYWALAHINGQWHFASTCGMAIDGPYMDGETEVAEICKIKLLSEIDLTSPRPKMYSAESVGVKPQS
ncbi:MAG: hypothetical protein R3C18_26160 [Planctomycetaceae bacterium]